jgi:hypothetical protein
MLNYKLRFKRWIYYNLGQIESGNLTTMSSGHIDDILALKTMPKEKLARNGFKLLANKKAPWLKGFRKKDLFIASMAAFNTLKELNILKDYQIVLYIYLKSSNTDLNPVIKNLEDIIHLMNNTPPEFRIENKDVSYNDNDENITILGLNNMDYKTQIHVYKDEEDNNYMRYITIKDPTGKVQK